jgi:hypothetical protein|tara:strand:+ start:1567 stop:1785 length:219 start_codon:yes stop_codon:yes gene_type:complete
MMDDFTLESEDFDENLPYVELQLDINDVHLIYRSMDKMLETWPGGHPQEQERLFYLKDFVYRIILEYKFKME